MRGGVGEVKEACIEMLIGRNGNYLRLGHLRWGGLEGGQRVLTLSTLILALGRGL